MKNRIVFEEVPSGVQFMDLVIDAMRSGRVLAMEYQAYNWEHSKDVLLEPYFVKLFRHRWYLIGINREYKAFRSYSLDRIKRIALSEETFNFHVSLLLRIISEIVLVLFVMKICFLSTLSSGPLFHRLHT